MKIILLQVVESWPLIHWIWLWEISLWEISIRDTYLDLDSFTLFYKANCNVTVAVTYLELDNVTSKLDTYF